MKVTIFKRICQNSLYLVRKFEQLTKDYAADPSEPNFEVYKREMVNIKLKLLVNKSQGQREKDYDGCLDHTARWIKRKMDPVVLDHQRKFM